MRPGGIEVYASIADRVTIAPRMFGRFVDMYRRLRWGRAPRYSIDTLPDNTFGKITGVVEALPGEELLVAPMSSRPCLFYSIAVVRYDEVLTPKAIVEETVGAPFVLRDGGQRAVIDPTHARVSLKFDHVTESRGLLDAHPHHRRLLERHRVEARVVGTQTLRYSEAILAVGARISVIGSGVQELDPTSSDKRIYRERGATRLRMMGSESAPLLISDHLKRL